MGEEYIGKHEIRTERPRYKVTKKETKKVSRMVYLLGITFAVCGIIVPSALIVKAGLTGLICFLRKLEKMGLFAEAKEIKQMLNEDLLSRKVFEINERNMERTHPSMDRDLGEMTVAKEVEEWNNIDLWYKNKNVVSYPTKKEL